MRRLYNDVTFIDTFLTPDFCDRAQLFVYKWNERARRYEISDREFNAIKQQLLFQLTNHGQPIVRVEDANFDNRGELLLRPRPPGDRSRPGLRPRHPAQPAEDLGPPGEPPAPRWAEKEKLLTHDGGEFRERTL